MSNQLSNIYNLPEQLPQTELIETLFNNGVMLIEKIVSTGQVTPPGDGMTKI